MKMGQIREKWISGKSEGQKMIFRSPVLLAGVAALAMVVNASAADIVDTAVAGNFNTLVAAVKAALPRKPPPSRSTK